MDEPTPKPGEVIVEVRACGLCGTDVHIAFGTFPPAPYPLIPGHEFAGEVIALGEGVTSLALGSRVAVDPTLACGACSFCKDGRLNLCNAWGAIGDTVAGGLAEKVAVPARLCYSLPTSMGWEEAALMEPLACAIWGVQRVAPRTGSSVLVFGGGTMGLLLAQVMSRLGCGLIAVVEPNHTRRELARNLGVEYTFDPSEDVMDTIAPEGYDVVIDATGIPAVIKRGLASVRRGGTFLVFGVSPEGAEAKFKPFDLYNRDLTIIGSMAVNMTFGRAVRLAPRLRLKELVAPILGLEAYPDAIASFGKGPHPKQQLSPALL